ncbi:DUF4355 domain-containing protein [Planomicrobium okeanokoites]|uniref:DUF4355 domain-containing protein n=1 Tax=Planomicrobium okeanokoites TaxID=244 RepID=A0ABV7KT51_PLAOK|nr:DUF4355 domain-containing protein [Planomicrobium okeanokoites]
MAEVNEQVDNTEEVDVEQQEEQQEQATFTQSEVDSRISKAVESALAKKEAKLKADYANQIEEAKKEAERLAKLSEKERKDEELKKREEQLTNRLKELEQKELKSDAISDLSAKGLPSTFADFLVQSDAETTLKNINAFKEAFDNAVNEAVKDKLRQDAPRIGDQRKASTESTNVAEMARKARIIK